MHPARKHTNRPLECVHPASHHALPSHTNVNTTHATAPPHFTVFLILGCGFTAKVYVPARAGAAGAAPHSGHTLAAGMPRRS
jgi:hypothetical protein